MERFKIDYQGKLDALYDDMDHLIEFILDPYQEYCFDDIKDLNFIMSQIKKIRKIIAVPANLYAEKEIKENGK